MAGSQALRSTGEIRPAVEVALWWKDELLDVTQLRSLRGGIRGSLPAEVRELLASVGPEAWAAALSRSDGAEVRGENLRVTLKNVAPAARAGGQPLRDEDVPFLKISAIAALAFAAAIAAFLLAPVEEAPLDDTIFHGEPYVVSRKTVKAAPIKVEVGPKKPPDPLDRVGEPRPRPRAGGAKESEGSAETIVDFITSGGGLTALLDRDRGQIDEALAKLGPGRRAEAAEDGLTGLGSRGRPGGLDGTGLRIGGVGTRRPGGGGPLSVIGTGLREKESPVVRGRTTVAGPGLDRAQIARVIQQHQTEILYCYESALSSDPKLEGKVAVSFTIDPAGTVAVAGVADSTIGNPAVEACILERLRRWRFPEPRGGGEVVVNFPWLFRPVGTD